MTIGEVSREFCGGTHASTTQSLFPFCILSEGSIGNGIRRMEAVAGEVAIGHLQKNRQEIMTLSSLLPSPGTLSERIQRLVHKTTQSDASVKVKKSFYSETLPL